MARWSKKNVNLEMVGFPDGINSADPPTSVGAGYRSRNPKLQCVDAQDCFLRAGSTQRRNGSQGQTNELTAAIRGLFGYQRIDGTENLIVVSNGKVYKVAKT